MTETTKSLKPLRLANVLKRLCTFKTQGYESTITIPPDDNFTRLLRTMKSLEETEMGVIDELIDIIKSENPKCKHPKKMQDRDPRGTLYCMKCGEDV